MRTQVNLRMPDMTIGEIRNLKAKTGLTTTDIIIIAIDRMFFMDVHGFEQSLFEVVSEKYLEYGQKPYKVSASLFKFLYYLRHHKPVNLFLKHDDNDLWYEDQSGERVLQLCNVFHP